jgi:pimeloyl-ACP methyl ester carboxylesterase
MRATSNALAKAGVMVANLEIIGAPGETGGAGPRLSKTWHWALLRWNALPKSEIWLYSGHSAGGHLALLLAANTRDIQGVIACGPVACLELAWQKNLGQQS